MKLFVHLAWCLLAGLVGVVIHVIPAFAASGYLFWPSIVWPLPGLFLVRIGLFAIVLSIATGASMRMSRGWRLGIAMAVGYALGLLSMSYAYWISASFYGRGWGPEYDPLLDAVWMGLRPTGLWAGLCGALTGWLALKLTSLTKSADSFSVEQTD